MCLYDAPSEVSLKIVSINPNCEAKQKLITMGIHADDLLVKLNKPIWGPVLVRNLSNGASKLAIGKGLAKKILVETHG